MRDLLFQFGRSATPVPESDAWSMAVGLLDRSKGQIGPEMSVAIQIDHGLRAHTDSALWMTNEEAEAVFDLLEARHMLPAALTRLRWDLCDELFPA